MKPKPFAAYALRRAVVTLLVLGALVLPGFALAAAEQVVDTWHDAPTPWALLDPCSGENLHGVGTESGVARATYLDAGGEHVRVRATGTVDLFDEADHLIGTWSYGLTYDNQIPPAGQGAEHGLVVGPLRYVDGSTKVINLRFHLVFEKGSVVKRAFTKSTCGG
jgi:hypothetical protein